jgi:BH1232 protein
MQIFTVLFRTIFFYFFVLIAYRIMGKREIGQLGVIDLIVSILIAELVAISIEEFKQPMAYTVIPITCLVILEVLFAFISIKSRKFRTIFDGKPSLIIVNGKINYKEMVKQRYSLDDLLVSLRQKEIRDIDMVEYAFLEPNGELSVFKYNFFKLKSPYPQALIVDGQLQTKVLKYIKKTPEWVEEELSKNNLFIKDIFYAFYKNSKIFIIKKTDVN